MLLSQIQNAQGGITVVAREGSEAYAVKNAPLTYVIAMEAAEAGKSLASVIQSHGFGEAVDLTRPMLRADDVADPPRKPSALSFDRHRFDPLGLCLDPQFYACQSGC